MTLSTGLSQCTGYGSYTLVFDGSVLIGFDDTSNLILQVSKELHKKDYCSAIYSQNELFYKEVTLDNVHNLISADFLMHVLIELNAGNEAFITQKLDPLTDTQLHEVIFLESELKRLDLMNLEFYNDSMPINQINSIGCSQNDTLNQVKLSVLKALDVFRNVHSTYNENYPMSLDLHSEQYLQTTAGDIICFDPIFFI